MVQLYILAKSVFVSWKERERERQRETERETDQGERHDSLSRGLRLV